MYASASSSIRAATSASRRPAQAGRPYPPPGDSEPFWPAQLTVLAAIAIHLLLPERLTVGPRWLVSSFEAALLIGMFKALHILYPDFADRWMRLPNSNPMFGSRPPIEWMTTDGGMDGLYRVRRLLDARRGGWN